ncbi:dTDP-4-dehydrorhamnose 3,5-epimerase family protein [Pirellulaceae bacterium SH467]
MIFTPTPLLDAYVIDLECRRDDRGFFARTFCENEFAATGLISRMVQCNLAFNAKQGTVRGMHWRASVHPEAKVVRVLRGAIWDVVIDLRPGSKTFLQSFGVELSVENRRAIYVPPNFAHGFQTLVDETEVFYQMSEFYEPALDRGAKWNDPLFPVAWPQPIASIHDRDANYPDLILSDLE